jgi:hypothetical protein
MPTSKLAMPSKREVQVDGIERWHKSLRAGCIQDAAWLKVLVQLGLNIPSIELGVMAQLAEYFAAIVVTNSRLIYAAKY